MYPQLLAALLGKESKTLVIESTGTSTAAIRKGLKIALSNFNQQMELCELPTIKGSISVSNPNRDTDRITIKLSAPQATTSFIIVEDKDNGE